MLLDAIIITTCPNIITGNLKRNNSFLTPVRKREKEGALLLLFPNDSFVRAATAWCSPLALPISTCPYWLKAMILCCVGRTPPPMGPLTAQVLGQGQP